MIPIETAGMQLDDDSWDQKEPVKAGWLAPPDAEPFPGTSLEV